MGMETSPTCDKCQEDEETAIHLMTTCPHYWWERTLYLGAPTITEEDIQRKTTKEILKFAQATKRWITTLDEDQETPTTNFQGKPIKTNQIEMKESINHDQ